MKHYKKKPIPLRLKTLIVLRDKGMCQNCGVQGVIKPWISNSVMAYEYEENFFSRIQKWEKKQFDKTTMEISHIIPEFLGGKNVAENLVLMCRYCNRAMGVRIWQEKE